jgi:predicted permease
MRTSSLAGLTEDFRYSVRLLRRQPRHALLTVLTLALGIGAATVLFSVTYGVLLKPFPWPNAERLVVLEETRGGLPPRFGAFTNAAYFAWRDQPATIDGIAAWSQRMVTLTGAGEPERIRVVAATATLFPVLGARPLAGSFFEEKDEASPVVVLSERLWRQRFSADPAVLGRSVQLDGRSHTVLGILPDGLAYPDRQTLAVVPYRVPPTSELGLFSAIAVLRSGVTAAQAGAEATARGRGAADAGMAGMAVFGSNGPIAISAKPLPDAQTGDVRRPLIVLLAAVGLLLLTATANAASLQLVRAGARAREITIRAALGARTARLGRQLLIESLLLGLIGGAVGLAFTFVIHRSLPSLLPPDFPRVDALGVDAVVLLFVLSLSLGASIACGLLPAFRLRRVNLVQGLAEDGTAPVGAGFRSRAARSRMAVMAGQVAIACVLLIGASLLGRSFLALIRADRGYDATGVLSARLSMPAALYPSAERRFAIVDQLLTRLRESAGVADVAFTSESPLTPGGSSAAFTLRSEAAGTVTAQASPRIVGRGFFSTLEIATLAGRTFAETDTESSPPVAVVNSVFARRYLGDIPIGTRMPMAGYGFADGKPVEVTVVGVVDAVRYITGTEISQPEVYYSYRQMRGRLPVQTVTILTRSSGSIAAAAGALQTAVREADPRLVADLVLPLEQRLQTTLARPRLYALLLGGLAVFAVIIAAVGLFSVLSYSVSLRSRELAIRAALGATRGDLLRSVLGQGLTVALGGVAAGTLASLWLASALSAQLYGVTANDRLTFAAVPIALIAIALLAGVQPAVRAAGQDPLRLMQTNR